MKIRLSRRRAQADRRFPFSLWLFAWQRDPVNRELRLTLHWPRLLGLVAVLALFTWLGGSTLVWSQLQHRGFRSVGLVDVVLPWRWSGIRAKRGGDLLARAREFAQLGRYDEAIPALLSGLPRSPDRESYLLLGRICAGSFRETEALDCLRDGFTRLVPDRACLELYFGLSAASGDLAAAEATALSLWREGWGRAKPEERAWLASQRVAILLQQERKEEALAWMRALDAGQDAIRLTGMQIHTLTLLGRDAEAIELFLRQPKDFFLSHAEVLPALAGAYLRRGDKEQCLHIIRIMATPPGGRPENYLEALDFLAAQPALQPAYDAMVGDYLQRYGSQEGPVARLGLLFLRHHDSCRLERLLPLVGEHVFTGAHLELAAVEAMLYDGRLKEAGQQIARLPALSNNTLRHLKADLLTRLHQRLSVTTAAESPEQFVKHLARHRLPLADYLQMAEILSRQGRKEDASELLRLARARYPRAMQLQKKSY